MLIEDRSDWKLPDIEGLKTFNGELIHSAHWPEDFDYKSKNVAVIGNGSSGVQIVPAMQPDVQSLVHFVGSPTWISPPQAQMIAASPNATFISSIKMDEENNFAPEQIEQFKSEPELYRKFVKVVEKEVNSRFGSARNSSHQ